MRPLAWIALLASLVGPLPAAASAPSVVVTIAPLHSLVAAIMLGVGEPHLLLRGNVSPHSYSMRPSQARILAEADLVVWGGPQLETFLTKPLATLGGRARIIAMADIDGIVRLPVREGGVWAEADHGDQEHGGHGDEGDEGADAHLWLDPDNAGALAAQVTRTLEDIDPANAPTYRRNRDRLLGDLAILDRDIKRMLTPVAEMPFLVFHDAYQYFERHYGLAAVGSVTVAADRQPGARRLTEIRERIKESGVGCMFREPQFSSRVIGPIVDGLPVRIGVLDPLGGEIASGPRQYGIMMRTLARAIHDCLSEAADRPRNTP